MTYVVERYHSSFSLELGRLQLLARACLDLHLVEGCRDLCIALEELGATVLCHIDAQERLFAAGVTTSDDQAVMRLGCQRLRLALGTARAHEGGRPKALLHGLEHFAAELEEHLVVEDRIARLDPELHQQLFGTFADLRQPLWT